MLIGRLLLRPSSLVAQSVGTTGQGGRARSAVLTSDALDRRRLRPAVGMKRMLSLRPITATSTPSVEEEKQQLAQEHQNLRNEARRLTLGLYRNCLRSIEAIRPGNEHDEKEFRERERQRKESISNRDPRLSMLSMLPPVNRPDELRSRAEYYQQYARENVVQESDCFADASAADELVLDQHRVERYLHHLRHGEKTRQYLLEDMKFEDPVPNSFDRDRIASFEQRAKEYCQRVKDWRMRKTLSPSEYEQYRRVQEATDLVSLDESSESDDASDEDGFWSSDEDSDSD